MDYNQIFVLASEMAQREDGEWDTIREDRNGFLDDGGARIAAVKVLREQGKVNEIVAVGGKAIEGVSKVELMAERIGGEVTRLESEASTGGNFAAIERHISGKDNGFLTHFYHLPRALRIMAERELNLIPICAEAVLLADNPHWMEEIRKWYSSQAMVRRFLAEIYGLSDLEAGRYK